MTFPLHTLETAPEGSREAIAAVRSRFGGVPDAVAKMATSPHLLNGFLQASKSFEDTSLDPVAREVVVMTVAIRNGCETCIAIHGGILERLGRADVVASLREDSALADPALEVVRAFVQQVHDRTGQVTEEELRRFLDAGYTQQNALEVLFGIGVYTMSTFANRLLRA